jgi:hypothetical protein
MSTDRDVTRIVRSWLEVGVTALPDRVLDSVLDQLPATPQRRAWWPAWRTQEMNGPLKIGLAAAAVVAAVAVGLYLLPRQGGGVGSPGVTPSPVVSRSGVPASATPSASDAAAGWHVAGTDLPGVPRLNFSADLPAGWTAFEFGATHGAEPLPPTGMAFFVSLIDNTFQDPCKHTARTPKVGSALVDAATALGQIPGVTAKAPIQITVAGQPATYVELLGPASLPCAEPYLWQDSKDGDWWLTAPNEMVGVWILDVEGQRVAVAARSWPETTATTKADFQAILDSMVFTAAP